MDETEEYKSAYRKKIKELLEKKKKEEEIKKFLARILDGEAYERLMNVKISNYELYNNVANNLIYFYQKIGRKITEKELLSLLEALTKRNEGEIKFYRK